MVRIKQLCNSRVGSLLPPVPGKQNLNSLDFPGDSRVIVFRGGLQPHPRLIQVGWAPDSFAKEMTQDGGWLCQNDQPVKIRVLSHAMSNKSLQKGGELEIEYNTMTSNLINQAYITKPQRKL